jgi:dihydrolipoamide dehydrogenase
VITEHKTQLAVIGAGPGGYPAAFHAADLGLNVLLTDGETNPGGVCLYRGCIPSKALLHVAAAIHGAREAAEAGVTFGEPRIEVERLRAWKQAVVAKLTGGLGQLRKGRGVEFLRGRARFTGPNTLVVDGADGQTSAVTFEQAILASGSSPARVPSFPDTPRIMDSTAALELPDIPKRLLVVGGGYIGLELGQAYAAFGSQVSVVEMLPALLANADADLVRPLLQRLKKQFADIRLETRVEDMRDTGDAVAVRFRDAAGVATEAAFDRVLVSVGRKPNTRDLGLEAAGVTVGPGGFVTVDARRRTTAPAVFAVGDVAGQPMLAHKATYEGKVAAEAIAGRKTIYDPKAIPAVVFTDPEIAWCGLTESEAKQQGRAVRVTKFPWGASGRATTLGRADGVTKLVCDPGDGRVLGVGMAGPGAGELIAEGVLAIEMGAVADDLAWTIHPHPTLSETVMEAAELFHGSSTHFASPKR